MRGRLAFRNTIMSMLSIFVSIAIGLIVPRVILSYYGSETNGLVSSINQFLNYITILESGVGASVVAHLYKPFAQQHYEQISRVISKSRSFFKKLVAIYLVYVGILVLVYPRISPSSLPDEYVSALVAVLGTTLFIQYSFTIHYSLLLQAAQRYYIASSVSMVLQLLNAVVTIVLITQGFSILCVKFISSLVFMINPLVLHCYVRKHYPLISMNSVSDFEIPQKKDTLIHNLSYVIHNNTDIVLITLFLGVKTVSVYSVHNMIVSSIRKLMESFSSGAQAAFGDMLAKNEYDILKKRFAVFEHLLILFTSVIFSVTAAMIIPFVRLYTASITDISYIQPAFAYLLIGAESIYIYRLPYHTLVKVSATFRETKNSALIEMLLNIIISLLLIEKFGLIGVAAGTFISMLYRLIYYVFFFRNRIVYLSPLRSLAKITVHIAVGSLIVFAAGLLVPAAASSSFLIWAMTSAAVLIITTVVFGGMDLLLYRQDTLSILNVLRHTRNN